MDVVISNEQQRFVVTEEQEQQIMHAIEKALEIRQHSEGELSVIWCDDLYIQQLNRQYRGKDCSTDVLSFAAIEASEDEPQIIGGPIELDLGDIFVSLETADRQAKEYNHSFEREVVYLVVHGVLHLTGMDHEREEDKAKMRREEERVMEALGLSR